MSYYLASTFLLNKNRPLSGVLKTASHNYNWNCILDFNFAAQNQSSKWGCDSSGQKTSCAG